MKVNVKVVVNIQYTTTIVVPEHECAKGLDNILDYARKHGREEYEDVDNRTTYADPNATEKVTGVVAFIESTE